MMPSSIYTTQCGSYSVPTCCKVGLPTDNVSDTSNQPLYRSTVRCARVRDCMNARMYVNVHVFVS